MVGMYSFDTLYHVLFAGVEGGKFFFNTVREGDQVVFACNDEAERSLWIQAIYRATGQSHKPVPPANQPSRLSCIGQIGRPQGGLRSISVSMCRLTILAGLLPNAGSDCVRVPERKMDHNYSLSHALSELCVAPTPSLPRGLSGYGTTFTLLLF